MPTRYLKPGICDSESIDLCDPLAECLFYRLLVNVDDYGRLDARLPVIKARCFPLKDSLSTKDIECLLVTLVRANLIQVYTTANGSIFLQMLKWDNVPRSKESKFPAFDDSCIQVYTDACALHTNLPVTVTETVTKTGTETQTPKKLAAEYSAEFLEAWEYYPPKSGANKKGAFKAWNARLKAGASAAVILDGVKRYALYCKASCIEPRYTFQPQTFFGPDEHYLSDWRPEKPRSMSVQESRLNTARQIMGERNGNDGSFIDFTAGRTFEGDGESIPEIANGIREPDEC